MLSRMLIANRGEIAIRIARTARRLGVETVGVYSEPDVAALHVDAVDIAVALGGTTASESYLHREAVLQAALATGCDAVHPGYGFLSESATFARAVIDAGLIWVGPTPDQIALLGNKVKAKHAAVAAGVPTAPMREVRRGNVPTDLELPVLVKAAAGGGGRGMRIVREHHQLPASIEAAAREAEAAFDDATVFIEPFIERGRHIEIQIVGDAYGRVVHLGERECSIQRRNQKVVEEAPSAFLDSETRSALCDGALALASHVGYQSAGTVEFLVADDGVVNFLEVNTRLQVEHPVTEAVTGLDLVELQLRVAAGEPLPIDQTDVTIRGHAIEVRLVAESPAEGWLPGTGIVTAFVVDETVRTDAGVGVGSVVSSHYDSLLAKVIAHAPTRLEAARRLARALRSARIDGCQTNADALAAILADPDFLSAATPTTYLAEHPRVAEAIGPTGDDRLCLVVAASLALEQRDREADSHWGFAPSGWRNVPTCGQRQTWLDETTGEEIHLELHARAPDVVVVDVGRWPVPGTDGALSRDERRSMTVRRWGSDALTAVEIDGVRRRVGVEMNGERASTSSIVGRAAFRLVSPFPLRERGPGRGRSDRAVARHGRRCPCGPRR